MPTPLPSVDIESLFYLFYRVLLEIGSLFDRSLIEASRAVPDPNTPTFQNFYFAAELFLFVVGVVALILIIYYVTQKKQILRAEENVFAEQYASKKELSPKNVLWESIQVHLATESQAEWKLAVIEADKLLDDITLKEGLFGATLGERLKNADETLFRTLQDAWEAHKIRNRIAHEAGYYLTRRDAQRAIGMYERVFREFKVI
jgi:hypothetical protein